MQTTIASRRLAVFADEISNFGPQNPPAVNEITETRRTDYMGCGDCAN
jgi:hypothetical protein